MVMIILFGEARTWLLVLNFISFHIDDGRTGMNEVELNFAYYLWYGCVRNVN